MRGRQPRRFPVTVKVNGDSALSDERIISIINQALVNARNAWLELEPCDPSQFVKAK